MSSSNWSDEEALEAAQEAGYEDGYALAVGEGIDWETKNTTEDTLDAWLEQQRRLGINILEPFQCRWDAAERRLVVEQNALPYNVTKEYLP